MRLPKPLRAWWFHNLVGHPMSEILWWVGLERASNWIHDDSMPDQEAEPVRASSFVVDGDLLTLYLTDNTTLTVPLSKASTILEKASPSEKHHIRLNSEGTGLHWPYLDEDLSVSGLVRDFR